MNKQHTELNTGTGHAQTPSGVLTIGGINVTMNQALPSDCMMLVTDAQLEQAARSVGMKALMLDDLLRELRAERPHDPVSVGLPDCQLCGGDADHPLHLGEAKPGTVVDYLLQAEVEAHQETLLNAARYVWLRARVATLLTSTLTGVTHLRIAPDAQDDGCDALDALVDAGLMKVVNQLQAAM